MDKMGRDYLNRAAMCLQQAQDCLSQGNYSTSVLRSAETVEFALKAALRFIGHSYKQEHDISAPLANAYEDFPPLFKDKVARFRLLSKIFTSLSLSAKYGDEILDTPPNALFSESDARYYLGNAAEVLNECLTLQSEMENTQLQPHPT